MPDLILRLMTALSIGLLVGLERGWREQVDPDGHRAAGIRTFAIAGLSGGVLAALTVALETPLIFAAGLLAFTAVFAWFHALEAKRVEAFSVTSVVAGLCVFALGGLAVLGDQVGYAFGKKVGPKIFNREESFWFKKERILMAENFYKKLQIS